MGRLINFCAGANSSVVPGRLPEGILINVPNNFSSEASIQNTHEMIALSQPQFIMLDSGGFQFFRAENRNAKIIFNPAKKPYVIREEVNVAPLHIIEAIMEFKPHIFMCLDFPVKNLSDKDEQEIEFMKKLWLNKNWAIETAYLKQKFKIESQLFVPIQCYNIKQFETFMRQINGVNCDGISLPIRNMTLFDIALFFAKFLELDIKRVHLLGISRILVLALAAFAANHLFEWISFDGTTWRMLAERNIYINQHNLSAEYIGADVKIPLELRIDCQCPWCKDKEFYIIRDLPQEEKSSLLACHNFYAIQEMKNKMYALSKDPTELLRFLKPRITRERTFQEFETVINILSVAKNIDFEDFTDLINIEKQNYCGFVNFRSKNFPANLNRIDIPL